MLEAIEMCQEIAGRELDWSYREEARSGDHVWWISDLSSFRSDYPGWSLEYDVENILREMYEQNREIWEESDRAVELGQ